MIGDKDTLLVLAGVFLMTVAVAGWLFGLGGLLAVGLMGISGWYGYAIGYPRGWRHSSEWRMERERRAWR